VRKRPVLGAFSGFFFGLFLGLTLLGFGAYALDSIMITLLPIIFLVIGIVGALWGPFARRATPVSTPAPPDFSAFASGPPPEPPPPPPGGPTPPPSSPPTWQGMSGQGDPPKPEGE